MSEYAIIVAGGKQHRVTTGGQLKVDLMAGLKKGDSVTFDQVLLSKNSSGTQVGTPLVSGAKVTATVVDNGEDGEGFKDKKVIVFKKRRRHGFHKKQGHRQRYTILKVDSLG